MYNELIEILNELKKLRETTVYSCDKFHLTNSIEKLEKVITFYADDGK